MIGGDGRVYEARGWATESGQTPIRNDLSLSIAFIGMLLLSVIVNTKIGQIQLWRSAKFNSTEQTFLSSLQSLWIRKLHRITSVG